MAQLDAHDCAGVVELSDQEVLNLTVMNQPLPQPYRWNNSWNQAVVGSPCFEACWWRLILHYLHYAGLTLSTPITERPKLAAP